jgi:hypothetical protein
VTAEEWRDAHRAAVDEDERHRVVTEDDVAEHGHTNVDDVVQAVPVDVRDVAAAEPRQAHENVVRVPSADEVGTSIARAKRALVEVAAREESDQAAAEDARAAELARWHDNDQADERAAVDDGGSLERGFAEPGYDRAASP